MSADITKQLSDRPNRRGFITVGAAVSAVVAGIAPTAIATAGADPLPALCARRAEIDAICNVPGDVPGYDALFEEWQLIQERVANTVATTGEGLIAQLRFLTWFHADYAWDDTCDRLVENMIAGVERLTTGGAA